MPLPAAETHEGHNSTTVSRVIGQEGANTLPKAENRIGMGARSIKCAPMEPIKILIIIALFAIVGSLGSALFHLSRGKARKIPEKMARALTIRIGLSLALFILLMLAWYAGLIKPTGLR